MARLIYNSDLHRVYPESNRKLKHYERVVRCPECGYDQILYFESMKVYPPFGCGMKSIGSAEENRGCGSYFSLEEIVNGKD